MDELKIKSYCLNLPSSVHDYQTDWEADRYLVGDKIFAIIGCDPKGKPIITLKCDPYRSEELRETYNGIIPGYYMNKTHWISIYFDSNVPDEILENLIFHSYELVFQKLPKKIQRQIKQEALENNNT